MIRVILFAGLYLGFTSSFALAAQNEPVNSFNNSGSSAGLFFQLIISLALVLGLIYLFFWILKKKNRLTNSKLYDHLGAIPLGQNKSVQIIEIGNKIYVLGVGEDISTISILESDEEIEALKGSLKEQVNVNFDFNSWIKNKLKNHREFNPKSRFELELAEKMEQLKSKRTQSMHEWLQDNERDSKSEHHEKL